MFCYMLNLRVLWKFRGSEETSSKPTILNLIEKFKETGSVHDRNRPDRFRSIMTAEALENVTELLNESSNLSIRQGAEALDMSMDCYHTMSF